MEFQFNIFGVVFSHDLSKILEVVTYWNSIDSEVEDLEGKRKNILKDSH